MKILMLSDLYPPAIGGGERHVEFISRALSRSGHQVSVCTMRFEGMPEYEQCEGVDVYRLKGLFQKFTPLFKDPKRRYHPPIRDPIVSARLRDIIEEVSPDIIHAHNRMLYSVLPLKRRFNIPIIFTLHSFALICPKTTLLRDSILCEESFTPACIRCGKDFYGLPKSLLAYYGTRMAKNEIKLVDMFIAVSMFDRDVHAKHLGLSDKDMVIIPNFVDIDREIQDEIAKKLPEDFILFVGALNPAKGVDLLIQAHRKLSTETSLVLIGVPHPDYHYQIADNVYIVESVSHESVLAAMSKCRFAVVPSILPETFATVAIEAMSQQKAVVASSIGGLREVVTHNETGILVPPNDMDSLSVAISYLLDNPEEALRMGKNGYRIFKEKYTAETVIPRIIEVYTDVIQNWKDRNNGLPS